MWLKAQKNELMAEGPKLAEFSVRSSLHHDFSGNR